MFSVTRLQHAAVCLIICGYFKQIECFDCSERICPTNLPYCSPAGCVFECPSGSFTEGKECKSDCGDRYIHANQCIKACPKSEPFIQVEVGMIGLKFVKHRYCRSVCPEGTYGSRTTCIRSCPDDAKFVEDGLCKTSCSPKRFLRNTTSDGQLTAILCVKSCNDYYTRRFVQNGYCVDECTPGQVVYKRICLGTCPVDADIRDIDESGVTFCKDKCDAYSMHPFAQNRLCVSKCNAGFVIANGTCVFSCPKDMNLKYIDGNDNVFCQDKCGSQNSQAYLLDDGFCVSQCKHGRAVYQNQCVTQCPKTAPVHVSDWDDSGLTHVFCRTKCDGNFGSFVFNNTCIYSCPMDMHFVFNRTCMASCPSEAPLSCDTEDYLQDPCSNADGSDGCVSQCPDSLPIVHDNKCTKQRLDHHVAVYQVVTWSVVSICILGLFGMFMSMKKCKPCKNRESGIGLQSDEGSIRDDLDPLVCEEHENMVSA